MQKVLSRMRKAITDYNMISHGDRIAVGVSGGKDSQLLLMALSELRKFLPVKFELIGITVALGFESFDVNKLLKFYNNLDEDYHIEDTQISRVVFEVRKEKNPCSLCANMKRGAFYQAAKSLGCNKAAFAHHMDDVIETLIMSLLYEGRIHTFSPVTYLDRRDITLIRPMIYTEEKMVSACVKALGLEAIKSGCPVDGNTKRQNVKELLALLMKENKHLKANLFGAVQRSDIKGWKMKNQGEPL
ncbi:MAG: ATP-binding protein [Bacillota bacterium]|jgi:tRNA 2-thiocytidine biosynthesis protein TtcA|nr:ATP-binding protein [Bacillota bacterium]